MKWLVMICILLSPSFMLAEMIEVPREELEEYLMRMEKDKAKIKELRISYLELQQEKKDLEHYIQNLESQLNNFSLNNIFIGGNCGYPLLNIDCMLLYQFDRNGIYILGGYNHGFNINLGYLRKL